MNVAIEVNQKLHDVHSNNVKTKADDMFLFQNNNFRPPSPMLGPHAQLYSHTKQTKKLETNISYPYNQQFSPSSQTIIIV
jgi:hypothetical protein